MQAQALKSVVLDLCDEIQRLETGVKLWSDLAEEELLYEVAVCVFSSQNVFEVAVAAADRLKERGFFAPGRRFDRDYEGLVRAALAERDNGNLSRLRFRNRLPTLLAETVRRVYGTGGSIVSILARTADAREARESLIAAVAGFGPKQASLFLRRVGFSADLAVLDRHVADYLTFVQGLKVNRSRLCRLDYYEFLEAQFRQTSASAGVAVGCLDLATWVVMRTVKRELGYVGR